MNGRERLSKLIYSIAVADGWKDASTHIEDYRAIDALTAELTEWAISYIEPFSGEHLESHPIKLLMDKAKALGYSPEDKSETN